MSLYPWLPIYVVGAVLTLAWTVKVSILADMYSKRHWFAVLIGSLLTALVWPFFWLVAII